MARTLSAATKCKQSDVLGWVMTDYTDPEIVYRVCKPWHVGLIVRSPDYERVVDLLARYARRFSEDFTAVAPAEETPEQHL